MEPEYHLLIKYFRDECDNSERNEIEALDKCFRRK